MRVVYFSEYQKSNTLSVLDGARWLIIDKEELDQAGAILFHSELLDILVGVDHRGKKMVDGLWQRAVHLILADSEFEGTNELELSRRTGITKVVLDSELDIESYCY